jgi:hypothetical protein
MVEGSPVHAHPFPNQGKLAEKLRHSDHGAQFRQRFPLIGATLVLADDDVGDCRSPTVARRRSPLRFPGQYAAPESGLDYKLLPSPGYRCGRAHSALVPVRYSRVPWSAPG